MPKYKPSTKVPKAMQTHYLETTELTDAFCEKYLNQEYQQLIRYSVAALCRKKLSPLLQGRKTTWAAAIIHAIGTANFLFDKSNTVFISAGDLAECFGLGKSTVSNKAKQVRELLKIRPFDYRWCLPSKLDSSMYWMITVNGFALDARTLPEDIQVAAVEKGLIPYVHAEAEEKIS